MKHSQSWVLDTEFQLNLFNPVIFSIFSNSKPELFSIYKILTEYVADRKEGTKMGNIGSQTGHINHQRPLPEEQWVHSFPRTQPRLFQHKVLPERDARQKLRHTNNGEILQSGGTLTGRQQPNRLSLDRNDGPVEGYRKDKSPRTYLPNQRDPLHKSGPRYTQAIDYKHFQNGFDHNAYREKVTPPRCYHILLIPILQMKKFGSEPDLRQVRGPTEGQRLKAKKKYKAPPPPNIQTEKIQSSYWEENSSGEQVPSRRARLFKTRTETKKNYSSPVNKHKSLDTSIPVTIREHERNQDLRPNRLSLPEINLAPDFHQELKKVTDQLRHSRMSDRTDKHKEKLKTLDHNIHRKDHIRQKLKEIKAETEEKHITDCIRGDGSGKESSSPDQSSPRIIRKDEVKTFYFGMEGKNDDYNNDVIDHFASNLHSINRIPKIGHSSESDISSEIELDESHGSWNGIDFQLRPILPKKQLEIPRFSPAAAWRLLGAVDSNAPASTIASDEIPVFVEDKIEKYSRPPPPAMQIGQRSNNDKSGDSGISGDAGPAGYDDGVEVLMNSRNNLQV